MPRPYLLPILAALALGAACSPAVQALAASGAAAVGAQELAGGYAVRGQVALAELAGIAAAGFKTVINNRPDGEEPGQPSSAELAAEAQRLGLSYVHIPVAPSGPTEVQARQLKAALRTSPTPVLAFCRSGKRAAALKAMADSLT